MATKSLYLRYRPRRFSEIKGQEHVVQALRNSVAEGREGQAYLFSGPRGTGKTTTARVLAKVLNCENPVDGEPCCECDSCLSVERGTSYDVHELDAASNNGVEAMRDLIEKASLGTPGRHKVYILDEVHMLSKAAEAALLKTLEEPPDHVVFVLATTDPQKMSDTIRSRTQHHQFRLLPSDTLLDHARWVAGDAGLGVSDDALEEALTRGGGSARDTLTALETIANAGGASIGHVELDAVLDAMVDRDPGAALATIAAAVGEGRDARTITEALVAALRNGFLALMAPELVQLPSHRLDDVGERARRVGAPALVRGIEVLGDALTDMRHAPDARVVLDVAVVKLTSDHASTDASALAARLDRLEAAIASGTPPVAPAPTAPPPSSDRPAPAPATEAAPSDSPGVATSSAPASSAPAPSPERDPSTGRAKLGSLASGPAPSAPAPTPSEPPSPSDEPVATSAPSAVATSADTPSPEAPGPDVSSESPVDQTSTPETGADDAPPAPPAPAPEPVAPSVAAAGVDRTAWETVRPTLKGMVKAVYAPAEFVTGGAASMTLSLPNDTHRDKCEQHRAAVEAALADHVGSPVAVELTVGAATPSGSGGSGSGGGGAGGSVSVDPAASSAPPARPPSAPAGPDLDRGADRSVPADARAAVDGAASGVPTAPGGDPGLRVAGGGAVAAAAPVVDPVADPVPVDPEPTSAPGQAAPDAAGPPDPPDLHVVASDGREIAERARRHGGDSDDDGVDASGAPSLDDLPDDADVDLDDLVDVPPENVATPLDRLAEAFPGSELVDDEDLY